MSGMSAACHVKKIIVLSIVSLCHTEYFDEHLATSIRIGEGYLND
jgi:hypothetical protein